MTGKTPSTSNKLYYGGKYMFITPKELHDGYNIATSEKTITEEGLNSIKANTIDGTSVLTGCIGWDMGNVAMCHGKCATNQQINAITDFKPQYNPYYVYYWLSTKKEYLFSIASVTRTPILSKGLFEEVTIPMPSIETQDLVVSILCAIDEKIATNKKICNKLNMMSKLLYDYWFVQFDFPDENGKPYKSSGGKMVWNEELKREIPDGWEVKKVGALLGRFPKTDSVIRDDYKKGKRFPIIDQSKEYICGYTDDETKILHIDNVIVFGDHTNIVKYVNFDFARGADGTQIINSNNDRIPNYLLYLQIKTLPIIEKGYKRHYKFLKEQVVIIPDKNVSQLFMNTIQYNLFEIRNMINENKELASLRDFLLPMLMNGQVKIKD